MKMNKMELCMLTCK